MRTFIQRWRAARREDRVLFFVCWALILLGTAGVILAFTRMDEQTLGLLLGSEVTLGCGLYLGLR